MENPNRPRSTDLDDVVVRWRAAARADGWRSMADWQVPSIGEVVADAVASADAAGSARRLGIERARAGDGRRRPRAVVAPVASRPARIP